jgi:drug/metabolite transporter (DMT)-like permease
LILFADIPDIFTFIGAAIIIVSGLYTVHRERLRQADDLADKKQKGNESY